MITAIDHMNISVTKLEEAKQFFTEILGFKVLNESNLEGEWIDKVVGLKNIKATYVQLGIPNAHTKLELIKYYKPEGEVDNKISQANQIGLRHLAFTVKNIKSIYEKVINNSIKVLSEIQIYNKQKKLFYFIGPEGVILECAEYGEF